MTWHGCGLGRRLPSQASAAWPGQETAPVSGKGVVARLS
jgi:hypothetical protein